MKKRMRILLAGLFALVLLAPLLWHFLNRPLPKGIEGAQAEEWTRRLSEAVGCPAWEQLGAVEWSFADRRLHLWDRERELLLTRYDRDALFLDLRSGKGWALRKGQRLRQAKEADLLQKGYGWFINDSFWLNPFCTFTRPEVQRALVRQEDGREALLVTWRSGGVTPGDSYLVHLGPDDLPTHWNMWVQIIPFGGVPASWEGWQRQQGVAFSSLHRLGPMDLKLEIRAAPTLRDLAGGEDPFAAFVAEFRGEKDVTP